MSIINIFKKDTRKLYSGTDMWMVKWYSFRTRITIADIEPRYQGFADEREARDFAESIKRAHRLIGNIGAGVDVTIEKQRNGL